MKKIKIILAGPGNGVEGGIPAVISGLEKCFFILKNQVEYKRLVYAKAQRGMTLFQRIFSEIIQFFRFIYQLKEYSPDIVHIQTSFDKKTILRDSVHSWITHIFKIKSVIHIHGGNWHDLENWNYFWKTLASKFLKKCELVIVTSEEELKWVENYFEGKVRVSLLNNVVELRLDIKKIRSTNDNSGSIKKIIFASRLIESKGILDLINAIKLLDSRNDFILHIYGSGVLEENIKAMIKALNLSHNVCFEGEIDFDCLLSEYAKGDIFVFPSYHHEGFPMGFFLAVASGLSVVTTSVRPIPNFLKAHKNCLYIEKKSPKSIAENISVLLDDTRLIKEMSKNNIELVNKFTSLAVSNELIHLYNLLEA